MNIISSNSLTDKQINDIKAIETLCNDTDSITFSLFTESDLNEDSDMPCFFMIYDIDNTELLAFLSLFAPGDGTAEVSACTHPECRQKGYFHALYSKACDVALQFDIDTLVFATSPKQQIALAVLEKYHAELDNTEYLLQYETCGEHTSLANSKSYKLAPATNEELTTHAGIFEAAFEYPHEAAASFINDIFTDTDIEAFSLTDIKSGNIVGCCYTQISDSQVMPFGICVHPDVQGQKLGQHMVSLLINDFLLKYDKPIMLQVSGSNENALHIYKKLGFKTASRIDYYSINIV